MLKTRIIPTLLWNNLSLVKGVGFNSWRTVGSALPAIKIYNARDVDELIIMDVSASTEKNTPEYEQISDFSDHCSVPLTVGGGIKSLDHISKILHAGADKILINTSAYENTTLIRKAAEHFGSQCIVVGIDVKSISNKYTCFSHSGKTITDKEPISWAKELENSGAGEIMVTSIDRDGSMQGYDLQLIEMVVKSVDIPVIASGGAGCYEHMCEAVLQAGASAVAAASIFHFTELTPSGARTALEAKGIPVRKKFVLRDKSICQ